MPRRKQRKKKAVVENKPEVSLTTLPEEILLRILGYLNVGEVLQMSTLSRYLHDVCAKSELWENLYKRYFAASFQLIQYLSRKHSADHSQPMSQTRQWKVEFQRKFTEKRCPICDLVYNCFTEPSAHSHKNGTKRKRAVMEKKEPRNITKQPQIAMSKGFYNTTCIDPQLLQIQHLEARNTDSEYIYKRKSKYRARESPSTSKRMLFARIINT